MSSFDCIKDIQEILKASQSKRFRTIEYTTYAAIGTVPDPRLKQITFLDPHACARVVHK